MSDLETLEDWIKFSKENNERWVKFCREKDERWSKFATTLNLRWAITAVVMCTITLIVGCLIGRFYQ